MNESQVTKAVEPRRELMLLGMTLAALLTTTIWSYGKLNGAHRRAMEDGVAYRQSEALAVQIATLRDQPTLADNNALQIEDMTRRIADAVDSASLDQNRLIAIEHQQARRIGRSAYLEEPTRLTFRDVTLRQTLTMLDELTRRDSRLRVTYLRLAAPRQDSATDTWTVDATVTYLIYEPLVE